MKEDWELMHFGLIGQLKCIAKTKKWTAKKQKQTICRLNFLNFR